MQYVQVYTPQYCKIKSQNSACSLEQLVIKGEQLCIECFWVLMMPRWLKPVLWEYMFLNEKKHTLSFIYCLINACEHALLIVCSNKNLDYFVR